MKKAWLPRTAAGQVAVQLVRRYYLHDVGRDSAALTYYLLFALFPLMVFVSTLLGILKLDVDSISQFLSQLVPRFRTSVRCGEIFSAFVPVRSGSAPSVFGVA